MKLLNPPRGLRIATHTSSEKAEEKRKFRNYFHYVKQMRRPLIKVEPFFSADESERGEGDFLEEEKAGKKFVEAGN